MFEGLTEADVATSTIGSRRPRFARASCLLAVRPRRRHVPGQDRTRAAVPQRRDGRQFTLAMVDAGPRSATSRCCTRPPTTPTPRRMTDTRCAGDPGGRPRARDRRSPAGGAQPAALAGRPPAHAEDQIESLAFRRVPTRLAAQAARADGSLRPRHAQRHPHRRAVHAHAAGRDDRHQPRDADQGDQRAARRRPDRRARPDDLGARRGRPGSAQRRA